MAFKFPFTNYHELNLTWILEQLKKLFEDSAENVEIIENYDGRLTAVETELPTVADTAQDAAQTAAAAATLAQTAKATADTAQENAIQAQTAAGVARQEAQAAQTAADAARQAAEQAQSTALNFDGRITQAENDAAAALEASRSFENRVQAAITTANNAAQTATNAQGIATRADQNAALALDTLNAQRSELERIGAEQAALIAEETEDKKTEIENLAQSVLDSIPTDYTELSALVDKKAPVIINSASGSVASFDDGADDMKVQKLVVNIEPVQGGSGDPSPTNIRPIDGHTGAEIEQRGKNLFDEEAFLESTSITKNAGGYYTGFSAAFRSWLSNRGGELVSNLNPNEQITISYIYKGESTDKSGLTIYIHYTDGTENYVRSIGTSDTTLSITSIQGKTIREFSFSYNANETIQIKDFQIEIGDVPTNFVEYKGAQVTVNFPLSAGTVCGATLTLNPDGTGSIAADMLLKTFNGSEAWFESSTRAICSDNLLPGRYNAGVNRYIYGISNIFPSVGEVLDSSNIKTNGTSTNGLQIENYSQYFGVTDIAGLTAYMANNPIQICYRLAEPVVYTLTASEVSRILKTLYGTNNIWSDAGTISVDYPADTKLYIDGKLAELQATILENI